MAQDLFISVQRQSRRLLLLQICNGLVLTRSAHNLQNFNFSADWKHVRVFTECSMSQCSQTEYFYISLQYFTLFTDYNVSLFADCIILYCSQFAGPQYATLFTGRSMSHYNVFLLFFYSGTSGSNTAIPPFPLHTDTNRQTGKKPAHLATTLFMTMLCFAFDTLHKEHSVCRNVFHLTLTVCYIGALIQLPGISRCWYLNSEGYCIWNL